MTANTTIVVDADHDRVDRKAQKTKGIYAGIGKEAQQVDRHLNTWTNTMSSAILRFGSVFQVIKSIGSEIKRQRDAAVGADRSTGASAVSRGRNLRALGLDTQMGGIENAQAAITGGSSAVPQSEIDSFLSALAAKNRSGKGASKISPQAASRALDLLRTGLFESSELMTGLESRTGLDKLAGQIGDRRSRLSTREAAELSLTDFERSAGNETQEIQRAGARRARVTEAQIQVRDARNPVSAGFRNVVESAALGAVPVKDIDQSLYGDGQAVTNVLRKISADISTMAQPRPTLATAPGGEQ